MIKGSAGKTGSLRKAQSVVEFTFATIVFLALVSGMVLVFRWVMVDLAERRYDHDHSLIQGGDAESQLSTGFHKTRRIDGFLLNRAP